MNPCLLMPTYNAGKLLRPTVEAALKCGIPTWVIVDGSTDGSDRFLESQQEAYLKVIRHSQNQGKGAAVLTGLRAAVLAGHTHALAMDSDGQHPTEAISTFLKTAKENPNAMILGWPQFDSNAPWERVWWRKVGNALVQWEAKNTFIHDALFGFRIYPIAPALQILESISTARRFDFDSEIAVRLAWAGVPAINLPVPVRYYQKSEGGVSHFRYGRDNLLLFQMHLRLIRERCLFTGRDASP